MQEGSPRSWTSTLRPHDVGWLTEQFPTLVVPDATNVPRRHVQLSAVWQLRERLAGQILLPDLADELGLRYHEAYSMLRRLGIDVEQRLGNREYQLTLEAADFLRTEHERVLSLHRRSMKLAAVASELKVAFSTVALLVKRGELKLDPETDSSGAKFVTRVSVEHYWVTQRFPRSRRTIDDPEGLAN